MLYETKCRLCGGAVEIPVLDSDDEACREMGIDPMKWMGKLICIRCSYRREGKTPPPNNNLKDFMLEMEERKGEKDGS